MAHNRRIKSIEEIADFLHMSTSKVYQLARNGKIPSLRIDYRWRFDQDEIEKWLAEQKESAQSARSKTKSLLRFVAIDDQPQILETIRDMIHDEFPESDFKACTTGVEGLLLAGQFKPDVLLLDLRMKGMDGYEVCRQIRQNPELKSMLVVAMTGYWKEETKAKAIDAGADIYIAKPFSAQELGRAIKEKNPLTTAKAARS